MEELAQKMNPLNIELIQELVFQHLEPKYLLNCRHVNHSWNSVANRRLKEDGWVVHLRGGEEAQEYLQLIQEVTNEHNQGGPNDMVMAGMDLSLHIDSQQSAADTDGARPRLTIEETLNAALEITRRSISVESPFVSLECTLGKEGISPSLSTFMQLNASTLRHISVHFREAEEHEFVRLQQQLNGNGMELQTSTFSILSPELQLPALKSICVEYASLTMHSTPALTRALLLAAPNLERIHVGGLAMSPVLVRALTDVGLVDSCRLSNLLELEIFVLQMDYLLLLRTMRFECLRKLRINCVGLGVLLRITQFVQSNCPALDSLKIIDQSPQLMREMDHIPVVPAVGEGGDGGGGIDLDPNGMRKLPNLAHFGYHLRTFPESPWVSNRLLADAEAILRTMHGFHNLTHIITNFDACIAIAKLFTSLGGNCKSEQLRFVPAVFRASKWPYVTSITLHVSQASIYEVPDPVLLHIITWVFSEMYPALEELVINLGTDKVTWKTNTDLSYVLGLAFGVRNLLKVDIHNYHNAWSLMEATSPYQSRPNSVSALKLLRIYGVKPSFIRTTSFESSPPGPAKIDLERVLRCVPDSIKPNLVLQIESELLINSQGGQRSYDQVLNEVKSIRYPHPRVKLC